MPGPPNDPWWRSGTVYQIYPRSFADADGNGIGDLAGVRQHLDHLAWLGVDAVWLSPFFRSPMADFGYDVADYCDVDPMFGDLATFDALLAEAHDRGIRVIVDLVPNHTSDQHPWFVAARSSRDDPKRDWYVWRDGGGPEEPPNNWRGAFVEGGRAWTWDADTEQWYLHQFLPQQPDLNWDNPEVVEAIHGVMRFWLDRGVDGFRIDVVHCIGRDPAFPDDVPPWSEVPHCASNEHPSTHAHIRAMRRLADSYDGRPGAHRRDRPPRDAVDRAVLRQRRRAAPRLQLRRHPHRLGRGGVAAPHGSDRRRCSVRVAPGRPGSSRTTTSPAIAPGWAAAKPAPGRRP